MKKPVLVAVAVIAVLALGSPPLIGAFTRSDIETNIGGMNENPVLALQVADYSRGWFSSQARIVVSLDEDYVAMLASSVPDDDGGAADFLSGQQISIGLEVAHGPIILSDGFYLGLAKVHARLDDSDAFAAMIMEEIGIPYVAELDGRLSFTSRFSFTSNVPPVDYVNESGQVSFSGLTVEGTLQNSDLQAEGVAERLVIDAGGMATTFEDFTLTGDSTRVNAVLWAGDFSSSIERVSVVNSLTGIGSMDLSGIRIDGSTDLNETGELFDARVTYAVDAFDIPDEEIALTDSELTIRFGNLSVAAVTQYYETMMTMDMQDPGAAAAALPPILAGLLEHNPTLALDPLRFTLNDESLEASISLRTVNGDQAGFDLTNPMMLLGLFEASATLTAAKSLLERLAAQAAMAQLEGLDEDQLPPGEDAESMAQAQTELMIATFLGQGYLIDDGETYSTEIEYANGEVRINGMPLPLGALL